MKKQIANFLMAVFLVIGMVSLSQAQTTTTSTTLSAAVDNPSTPNNPPVGTITVASATGFTAKTTMAYVDQEAMLVTAVSGTTISVIRGSGGTRAIAHTSGETVWVGPLGAAGPFVNFAKYGSCTSAQQAYIPQIVVPTGDILRCTNSEWALETHQGAIKTKFDLHMLLDTTSDDRAVRINSRNYSTITTGGTALGFQSNPAQNVSNTTGTIKGGEIIPRINDGFTASTIEGLHVASYLKGTTSRTMSGDVRGLRIELVTDNAATNVISGTVSAISIRTVFSATTITGTMSVMHVEVPETQTNSQDYDAFLDLTGTSAAWGSTGTPSTQSGFIKLRVNSTDRYIQLFTTP